MRTKLQQFLKDAPFAEIKVFKYLLRYTDRETGVIEFNPLRAYCLIADMGQGEFSEAILRLWEKGFITTPDLDCDWIVCNIRAISTFHPVGRKRPQRPRFKHRRDKSIADNVLRHSDGTASVSA